MDPQKKQKTEEKQDANINVNPMYLDPVYLNRYLHFNFATNEEFFSVKSQSIDLLKQYELYPVKIAKECLKYYEKHAKCGKEGQSIFKGATVLDLGCGMGRTAFELAVHFDKAVGLDYAAGFIDVANELKEKGEKPYTYKKTGEIYENALAKIDPSIDRSKTEFIQGDAMNLPTENFGPFELIIASNLIDRLEFPMKCIDRLPGLVAPGGILVITSPYTWMESVADQSVWIGGREGKNTFQALQEVLIPLGFELLDEQTMTLFIKEHERKFEFIMPHMTAWRKTN